MILYLLSVVAVFFGLVIFVNTVYCLSKLDRHAADVGLGRAWRFLLILIAGFCCSHVFFLVRLLRYSGEFFQTPVTWFVVSLVFFFGASFTRSAAGLARELIERVLFAQSAMIAAAPFALILVDKDGRIILMNPAAEIFLRELGAESKVGQTLMRSLSADTSGLSERFHDLLAGEPFSFDFSWTPAGGSQRWMRCHGKPIPRSSRDRTSSRFLVAAVDITVEATFCEKLERTNISLVEDVSYKTAELQKNLEKSEVARHEIARQSEAIVNVLEDITEKDAALRKSEEKYRAIVENQTDMLYTTDPEWKVTYVSRQVSHYGYAEKEIVGRHIIELTHPDDHVKLKAAVRKALDGEGAALTVRLRIKDGSYVWVELTSQPSYGSDGAISGAVGTARDVTDRVLAEIKVRELDVVKNRFIQFIANQIRSPLVAINWNLERLADGQVGKLSVPQRDFIGVMRHAGSDLSSQLNDILTAIAVEEKRVDFRPERASLHEIVSQVAQRYVKAAGLRGQVFRVELPATSAEMMLDREKISEAVAKLLDNALAYSAKGGSVTLTVAQNEESARIEVRDDGIGIPAAEQPRIPHIFFRGTNAAALRPNAAGVGLVIAKRYAEGHGGSFGFESQEGKGSVFWIELPIRS